MMSKQEETQERETGKNAFAIRAGILLLKGLSWLPFWFQYGLADLMAFILKDIVKYRKKVVFRNLEKSFPDKGSQEIKQIADRFYRHLCDIMLETMKGYSLSEKEFSKRVTVRGADEMNRLADEGKSVILLGMHYNNWEWSSISQRCLKHRYMVLYNPMRGNPLFEEYLQKIRTRWGAEFIPVHKSARAALAFHQTEHPIMLVLGADQRPPRITRFWTTFLNQETCFNSGPVKIAIATRQPIYFHLTRKIKRGHYEISFIPLFENPEGMQEEEILRVYVQHMEKYIKEEPAFYLWSHKRWKQQRPEGYPLF